MEDPENQDSTDGIIDSIKETFQPILDKFKEQTGQNEDKKSFIGGPIRIFTILLSVRTSAPIKILNIIKESINLVVTLWPEQKQQSEE